MMSGSSRNTAPQRRGERARMAADLALIDHAVLVSVDEFHRVLDGQDVVPAVRIGVIDQRCQGGGFAAAGRPGDQHEPLRQEG